MLLVFKSFPFCLLFQTFSHFCLINRINWTFLRNSFLMLNWLHLINVFPFQIFINLLIDSILLPFHMIDIFAIQLNGLNGLNYIKLEQLLKLYFNAVYFAIKHFDLKVFLIRFKLKYIFQYELFVLFVKKTR